MRYASVTDRLADLGGAKWAVHARARALKAAGEPIIELTIGEPDVATPEPMLEAAARSMRSGRTGYSNGRGEPGLVAALAARYTARFGEKYWCGSPRARRFSISKCGSPRAFAQRPATKTPTSRDPPPPAWQHTPLRAAAATPHAPGRGGRQPGQRGAVWEREYTPQPTHPPS